MEDPVAAEDYHGIAVSGKTFATGDLLQHLEFFVAVLMLSHQHTDPQHRPAVFFFYFIIERNKQRIFIGCKSFCCFSDRRSEKTCHEYESCIFHKKLHSAATNDGA